MFSWNCKACGEPIQSIRTATTLDSKDCEVVAITRSGEILEGDYDGSGRIDGMFITGASSIYHSRCFKVRKAYRYEGNSTEYLYE